MFQKGVLECRDLTAAAATAGGVDEEEEECCKPKTHANAGDWRIGKV